MLTLTQFATDHWFAITSVSAYVFIGAVAVMPKPGDPRPFSAKAYEAFYDLLHMLANKAVERKPSLALNPPAPKES